MTRARQDLKLASAEMTRGIVSSAPPALRHERRRRARSETRWGRLIAGVCLVGGMAFTWAAAPSGAVHAESAGCTNLNDPANGYNGQNTGNSVTGLEFGGHNDRIYITAATPASDGVIGYTVKINGSAREVPGLPTELPEPGQVAWVENARVIDLEWAVLLEDGVPATGDETLTWTVNCDPGPEVLEARTICRDGTGLVVLDIEESDLASYRVFVYTVPFPGDVEDQFDVDVSAAGLNSFEFGPYPNDTYGVAVEPLDNLALEFLIESVSIDCEAGETTPPTSETPTTPPTSETPTTQATPLANVLPETGPTNTQNFTIASACLILVGAVLIAVRRGGASKRRA